MVNYFNYYTQKIQILRELGNEVMQQILSLEIGMNRRKQQNEQPHNEDIVNLTSKVAIVLKMLAEIKTCKYFKTTLQIYDPDSYYYKQMCKRYFNHFLQQLNKKLNAKQKHKNQHVDFVINS